MGTARRGRLRPRTCGHSNSTTAGNRHRSRRPGIAHRGDRGRRHNTNTNNNSKSTWCGVTDRMLATAATISSSHSNPSSGRCLPRRSMTRADNGALLGNTQLAPGILRTATHNNNNSISNSNNTTCIASLRRSRSHNSGRRPRRSGRGITETGMGYVRERPCICTYLPKSILIPSLFKIQSKNRSLFQ